MATTERDRAGTRTRLIDVAERLFAERGIESVAMRQVAVEAGQRNHSAVQYHFGSRDGLVAAIIAERSRPIDARRAELISSLDTPTPATAASVVRAFARPLAEVAGTGGHYLRFLAHSTDEPTLDLVSVAPRATGMSWVHHEVTRLLAGAPGHVVRRRARWLAVATLRILADHEGASAQPPVDEVVDDLVLMLAPLLDAPA